MDSGVCLSTPLLASEGFFCIVGSSYGSLAEGQSEGDRQPGINPEALVLGQR